MASLTELIANVGNTPKIRTSGLKSDYLPKTTHKDMIYFSIDSYELLFNGKIYGGNKIPIFTPEEITDESIRNEFLENGLLGDNGTLLYIPDLTNSEDKPSELILNPLSADDPLYIFRRDINEEDKAYFCLSGFVQDIGEESYGPDTIIQICSLQLIDFERGIWLLILGYNTIMTSSLADVFFYDKHQVDTKINDVSTKLTNFLSDNAEKLWVDYSEDNKASIEINYDANENDFCLDIPYAASISSTNIGTAGLMSAQDKTKLDSINVADLDFITDTELNEILI